MRVSEHKISKVCKEIESKKYLTITNTPNGYAKLCCYTVKLLQKNNIMTSYENICVAMWIMFPSAEHLHLSGFEDMPDTDYMEKLIKLRSTPKAGNYLIGGNYMGRTSEYGLPWRLTKKGERFAKEAEVIIQSSVKDHVEPQMISVEINPNRRGTINYDTEINPILNSNLYKRFFEELHSEGNADISSNNVISEQEICSTFNIYYPTHDLKQKVQSKKKVLRDLLSMMNADGVSTDKATALKMFLTWLDNREINYE